MEGLIQTRAARLALALHVEQHRAVKSESVKGERLREDVSGHLVGVDVLDANDVPLVQVAHVRCPALEVLRLGRETVRLDDVDTGGVVAVARDGLGDLAGGRSSERSILVYIRSLAPIESTAVSASALESGTILRALACQLSAAPP